MKQLLTKKETERTQQLCFDNPAKACAIAQLIIDTCQMMSCSTFAAANGKSPRTVQYQAEKLTGLTIENRKFVAFVQ